MQHSCPSESTRLPGTVPALRGNARSFRAITRVRAGDATVDSGQFDRLTRLLALSRNRRTVLKSAFGGTVGVLSGAKLSSRAAAQSAACAEFCKQLPPGPGRGQCVSDAAAGTGLCFQCGPASADPTQRLCGNVCVNLDTDPEHCGSCTEVCDDGENCIQGSCTTPCPLGQTPCDGQCVSLDTDPRYCGSCDISCTFPHASASCVAGNCRLGTCEASWGNCNSEESDGCEHDLSNDVGNCGSCNTECSPPPNSTATCQAGSCSFVCLQDFANCDNNASTGCERNLSIDPDHCGSCEFECPAPPNATATCVDGNCGSECIAGYSLCGESCCPDGFCLDDGTTCVGGICFRGGVGCNPGPSHCVCLETYAGPTICTPAFGAFCSAQRCSESDPPNSCPSGSYCIPTSCDGPNTLSGRCAPLGFCMQDFDCGTDSCSSGETCQADGICRP